MPDELSGDRWRRLLGIVGVIATLSGIAGELGGYFHFLQSLDIVFSAAVNWLTALTFGGTLSVASIFLIKMVAVLSVVWLIFYLGLHTYSRAYHNSSLADWIYWDVVFLHVPKNHTESAKIRMMITLFLAMPLLTLIAVLWPPWSRQKFVHCSGLHINLWPYLYEIVFLHAVVFSTIMAIHLGFKFVSATLM